MVEMLSMTQIHFPAEHNIFIRAKRMHYDENLCELAPLSCM